MAVEDTFDGLSLAVLGLRRSACSPPRRRSALWPLPHRGGNASALRVSGIGRPAHVRLGYVEPAKRTSNVERRGIRGHLRGATGWPDLLGMQPSARSSPWDQLSVHESVPARSSRHRWSSRALRWESARRSNEFLTDFTWKRPRGG